MHIKLYSKETWYLDVSNFEEILKGNPDLHVAGLEENNIPCILEILFYSNWD